MLIVITPELVFAGETDIVNRLFDEGLEVLHLRKPGFSAAGYEAYLGQIPAAHRGRIVLHGGFELFAKYGLNGVHLNSTQRTDTGICDQLKEIPVSRISASFHSWQEIAEDQAGYRYVFISPVADSISKQGYLAAIDLAGASRLKDQFAAQGRPCPKIVALGGVDVPNIEVLYRNEFDGYAVLGAVWQSPDPAGAFRALRDKVRAVEGS